MDGGTGRCLCGAVRYAFEGAPDWQVHCHCESCRRATAAPFTSFLGVARESFRWTGAASATYASSPGVTRSFCPVCGTQMAYQTEARPEGIDLYAATLDDPAAYRPTGHVHWNEHLAWVRLADGLPVHHTPRRLTGGEDMEPILNLVREAFAYMDGIVDPPSSAHRLTAADLAARARDGEVWVIDELDVPLACMVLTPEPGRLSIGKLAVAAGHRRKGLARQLLDHAAARARALGLPLLEMRSRVELTGNHAAFAAMGFARSGETAHPGYDRPTSVTFERAV